MHSYLSLLQTFPLFEGFSSAEIQQTLTLLAAAVKQFKKGDTILPSGAFTSQISIVLAGEVTAHKISPSGHIYTAARFVQGGIFGDLLAASGAKSPVTLTARTPCHLLTMEFPSALTTQPPVLFRLYANIIRELSSKYFALDKRIDLLLLQSLRKKIAAYLLEASAASSLPFSIPFNRTALAQHLGCDRSALCRELSRMVKEGLLETQGQIFKIPQPDKLQKLLVS